MLLQEQLDNEDGIEKNEEKKLERELSNSEEEKTSADIIKSTSLNPSSSTQPTPSPSGWQTWKSVALNDAEYERSKCDDCVVLGKAR